MPKNCVGVRGEADIGNELNMLGLGVDNSVGDCGSGMDGAKVVGEGKDGGMFNDFFASGIWILRSFFANRERFAPRAMPSSSLPSSCI